MTSWKLVASIRHRVLRGEGRHDIPVPRSWLVELLDKFEAQEKAIADLKEDVERQRRLNDLPAQVRVCR